MLYPLTSHKQVAQTTQKIQKRQEDFIKKLTSKRKVHLMCGYSTYSYNKNTSNSKTHTIGVSNGKFTFDGTTVRKECTAP